MQGFSLNDEESLLALDSDGRIICVSPDCVNILHAGSELLGRRIEEVVGESSELASACYEMLRDPKADHPSQLRFGLRADTGENLLAGLHRLECDGEITGIIVTLKDLRQVRREEMRVRRTERLNVLARLAASLAHEIRNPLNALVINLEVLKNTIKQLPPESLRKADSYVKILSEELERLNSVLDNFLGLANTIEVVRSSIEVNQIARDLLNLMRHQAEQARIEIIENIDRSNIYIEGNADQIKQAILNLILNAIEAMPEGGRLSVSTRRESDLAIIEIADTGTGIPEEIQDDIFDFYFTTKEKGMGLGLPIAARIVEFHHGGMDLESVEGEGTKFILDFPLSAPRGDEF